MSKRNAFMNGFVCAVTQMIKLDGLVTSNTKELWAASGAKNKDLLELDIDISDIEFLTPFLNELNDQQ